MGALSSASLAQKPGATGGAITQNYTYNGLLQMKQMNAVNASSASLLKLSLVYAPTYDANTLAESTATNNGNPWVEKLQYDASGTPKTITRTFGYDAINRISSISEDTGNSQNFNYDAYGNIWDATQSHALHCPRRTNRLQRNRQRKSPTQRPARYRLRAPHPALSPRSHSPRNLES